MSFLFGTLVAKTLFTANIYLNNMRKAFWLLLLCLAVHGCKQNNHGSQNLPTTQVSESEKEIVSKEMIADLNKKEIYLVSMLLK